MRDFLHKDMAVRWVFQFAPGFLRMAQTPVDSTVNFVSDFQNFPGDPEHRFIWFRVRVTTTEPLDWPTQ
jgi:hypothetical protein